MFRSEKVALQPPVRSPTTKPFRRTPWGRSRPPKWEPLRRTVRFSGGRGLANGPGGRPGNQCA